jgi:hypothetical protein
LVLKQNLCEGWVRWHPKPHSKKFIEHNSFIIGRFRNSLLPWLTRRSFDKISQRFQLPDTTHSDGQEPEIIASHRLTRIHNHNFFNFGLDIFVGPSPRGVFGRRAAHRQLQMGSILLSNLRHITNNIKEWRALFHHRFS